MMNAIRNATERCRSLIRRAGGDARGVAAVEFALILPLMLVLYVGTAELTSALMANRKMTVVARALSDLVAQETDEANGVSETTINNIFAAASAIMAPFNPAPLQMTVSSVRFVPDGASPPNYTARTVWSIIRQSGQFRPCGDLTKVGNTVAPSLSTMPEGLYQAGTIIVSDVKYNYTPGFGGALLAWSSSESSIQMSHTTYMKPRTQAEIKYTPASVPATSQICP